MNVGDMVRKIRSSLGDTAEPYQISTEEIFDWLNEAYTRIQLESTQWRFFHYRGLLISAVPDVSGYSLAAFRQVEAQGLYAKRPGMVARYPILTKSYDWWQMENQVNYVPQGFPHYLIQLPSVTSWLIQPTPTEPWEIYGDAWYAPATFGSLADEPIWDEIYHDLVRLEALKIAAAEWPNEKESLQMMARAQEGLLPMKRSFCRRYLEPVQGARAML
jgi:hypothetical protein